MQPTLTTWMLVIFGVVTLIPLFLVQFMALVNPSSQKTKELLIGDGEDWRDKTHFKMALAAAWADWLFFAPIFVAGSIGMLLAKPWGYALFSVAGACSLYINIILWFTEKEYVYPSRGPLKYYTYYWGFFMYWGALALIYGLARLNAVLH